MRNTFLLLGALFISNNYYSQDFVLDQTDPESVVEAMFYAAKYSDFDVLCDLCTPNSDSDTRQICNLCFDPSDHELKKGFIIAFRSAKITQVQIQSSDRARVEFVFGPPGERMIEYMKLVKLRDKWYLNGF